MEIVTIKTFDNYFTANIILTKLQAAGFECHLFDENTVTVNPIMGNIIGGIKLVVNIDDADEAAKTLNGFEEEYLRWAECPKCGANDILLVPKQGTTNLLTTIFTWIFSSYAVSAENIYQCQQCGYESKTLPENKSAYN